MKKLFVFALTLLLIFTLVGCQEGEQDNDYNQFKLIHDQLIPVKKDNLGGYINIRGETVIDFQYDFVLPFFNGYAIVKKDDYLMVIDVEGQVVVDDHYTYLQWDYESGLLNYSKGSNEFGLLSVEDGVVLDNLYQYPFVFSNGLSKIFIGNKFGFINTSGEIVIPVEYDIAYDFKNGFSRVFKGNKWGFINPSGDLVVELKYDGAIDYTSGGFAVVFDQDNNLYNLIDETGKVLLSSSYINGSGDFFWVEEDGYYFLYKEVGRKFNDMPFKTIIYDGLMFPKNLFQVIDENNRQMVVWFNEDGTIYKESPSNLSYINLKIYGNMDDYMFIRNDDDLSVVFLDSEYEFKADFFVYRIDKDGFILKRANQYGIVDAAGEVLVNFEYDDMFATPDGYIVFAIDGLYGVMDLDFNVIIQPEYQYIYIESGH